MDIKNKRMEEKRRNIMELFSYHEKKQLIKLEQRILQQYEDVAHYARYAFLLTARKQLIDHIVLEYQEIFLADIVAFNEALWQALKQMHSHAHQIWDRIKGDTLFGNNKRLIARCFLPSQYPLLHPIQRKNSEELYHVLQDTAWNKFYDNGVSLLPLELSEEVEDESFESFIGMDCPPPNWNEGLDQELTKDLHLIRQFNYLFEYTNFALTDFIYCREFNPQIDITLKSVIA